MLKQCDHRDNTVFNITTSYKNAAGTTVTDTLSSAVVSSDDPNAYDVDAYNKANGTNFDTIYLYDTGTVIFGAQAYSDVQMNNATIMVDYTKKEFEKSDIRPEMYFDVQVIIQVQEEQSIILHRRNRISVMKSISARQLLSIHRQKMHLIHRSIVRSITLKNVCRQWMS